MSCRVVLVVCSANQCRSPMALALIESRVRAAGLSGAVQVRSAGTWAEPGHPATAQAIAEMQSRGIDLSEHRSREVDADLMAEADLVLVMTDGHRQALAAEFGTAASKMRLFSELGGGQWDIADPIGLDDEAYRATADELAELIDAGWAEIVGDREALLGQ